MMETTPHTATKEKTRPGTSRAVAESIERVPFTGVQEKLNIGQPGDAWERQAEAVADQVMAMPEARVARQEEEEEPVMMQADPSASRPWIRRQSEEEEVQLKTEGETPIASGSWLAGQMRDSSGGGEGLPAQVARSMGRRFGSDFSGVRVFDDTASHHMSSQLGAQAFTYDQNVYFNEGRYRPGTSSGDHLLAHELTHVVQQGGGKADQTVQRALADVPAADRRQMIHSFIPVPDSLSSQLNGYFATDPALAGGATESYVIDAQFVFSTNIPETSSVEGYDVRRGLRNVAGWLVSATNILPLNSVVSVQLDISRFGGTTGIYRFSYYDTTRDDTVIRHMDIELRSVTTAAPPQVDMPEGQDFQVGGATFHLGSGWNQDRFNLLMQALGLMPASVLTAVAGITFEHAGNIAGQAEAGQYNPDTHTIVVRSKAFDTSLARYGSYTEATRVISHEIGHALDYVALRRAWTTYEGNSDEAALERARSISGLRYTLANNLYEVTEGAGNNDYRRAVQADRVATGGRTMPQAITTYGATNWEENYAEAFSMYVTDPDTFQQLRPNTYQYFRTHL